MVRAAAQPRPGSEVEIVVERIDLDGSGVGPLDQIEVHIARALPGDRVRARIASVARHKPAAYAELIEIVAPAAGRRPSPCPLVGACDGCALIALEPAAQAGAKLELLRRELTASVLAALLPGQLITTPPALGYRRRAKFVVARIDGVVRLGAYRRRSHQVTPTETCPVVTPAIASALPAVAAAIEQQAVPIADGQQTGLRFVQLRSNDQGELLITLVAAAASAELQRAADAIAAALPSTIGVTLDLNPGTGDAVLGGQGQLLAGRGTLDDTIGGVALALGPYDFVQLHGPAGDRLGQQVAARVAMAPAGVALDLYAGVGTLGLAIARSGRQTIAIEQLPSAAQAGRDAACRAGLAFGSVAADSAEYLAGLAARAGTPAAVVVDPPRRGLGSDAVTALLSSRVPLLIYVSCWPRALARDLEALAAGGFRPTAVEAHDLFPQTPAVEALVVLER